MPGMGMRIQLLGIPTDVNSSYRRGAAGAPKSVRAAWRRYGEFGNYASECGPVIGEEPQLEYRGRRSLGHFSDRRGSRRAAQAAQPAFLRCAR